MAEQTSAAELPDNSVVADTFTAYIKTRPAHWAQWRGTDGSHVTDSQVDEALANGGQVLRVGAGTEADRG